jgi:PKD repeat protein
VVAGAASAAAGTAPLSVDFTATSQPAGAEFAWDFGGGATAVGPAANHVFTAPGVHPVVLRGTDETGVGTTVLAVSVEGAAGAGPGTTPPASRALAVRRLSAAAKFPAPGKDKVSLVARLEMPAGWTPGMAGATVFVAGVEAQFTLGTGDSGANADGAISLRYRRAKGGAPLAAGVVATVTVALSGDLAARLADFGMRDATESRTLSATPVVVMLGDLAWRGTADVAVRSKAGARSKAALAR